MADVRQVQSQGKTVISLMRGEPDFKTPPHIAEAAVRALQAGRTGYPDNRGEIKLREAVAAKLLRDNSSSYDPGSEILVTTGATMGLYCALTALLEEGDEVLLPDPIYDAYQSPIFLAGGKIRSVRAPIVNGRWVLTRDALEAAVTPATRVLLINTPWNPVGTVFSEGELRSIAEFAVERNLWLISDEIYEAIIYDGKRHVSAASLSSQIKARTIVVNALSKTYAMTGWRVGYCAAPEHIVQRMFLVLQQFSRGPATFIQDAAAVALTGSQDAVEEMRRQYAERRSDVAKALGGLSRVRPLPPEGGFFSMVDARDTGVSSNDIRRRLLNDHGVVVAHGAAYGAGAEGTLRVSFGSGGDTLARGLERLREGLSEL